MADLPQRPPLPPHNSLPAPSPLPTPPSSTTTIPLCFPSPTSVAHVVEQRDHTRKKAVIRDKIRNSVTNTTTTAAAAAAEHPIPDAAPPQPHRLARPQQQPPKHLPDTPSTQPSADAFPPNFPNFNQQQRLDHDHPAEPVNEQQPIHDEHYLPEQQQEQPVETSLYERTDLANTSPSNPLDDVTKSQFSEALQRFVDYTPPNSQVQPPILASRIRDLLDHLDALVEQLTLRLTNKLFDALSHQKCLAMLLFLLSDISARSTPVMQDIRKSYRYPYLVTNILANGNNGIRESFLDSKPLVAHLLSFLDGRIPLSSPDASTTQPVLARSNPIIVGNVVQILVSYMETSTESLLQVFENRPSFVPAVVDLLDTGSVTKLLTSIIPDRCVQDVETMDHAKVSFDLSLTKALSVLSASTIFHHLSDAFVNAAQTIFSVVTNSDELNQHDKHRAEQLAYNVTQVYSTLVKKTIRAVRINTEMPECRYLNVYAAPESASTVSQILRVGTELFRETAGDYPSVLDLGLSMTVQLLRYVEEDKERRVASVSGQPPPLDTAALEEELEPVLRTLMSVLIDTVNTGSKHSSIRLRILELFVECTRVMSESMMGFIDKLRFGEVALKMMLFNPRNSLMQHVVCRGVETALISQSANATSAKHWLSRTKLVQKILKTWEEEEGDHKWNVPGEAQNRPFLSALIQMACCVQHYHAIQAERCGEKKKEAPMPILKEDLLARFETFCSKSLTPILSQETPLCGPKPRRRPTRPSGGLGRSFGVLTRARRTGSGGAHLVRSPSAHRFGYVAPVSSLRSRFDEVFVEGEEEEFEAVGCSSLASVFDADVSDALG